MQERQLTLLKNLQVLPSDPPASEECCDLVIQATKEKCTEMLLCGPLLTEIVEVVQKIKQIS